MSSKRALAFWLAVALQVVIVAALPWPKLAALRTGRTVLLQVMPVDPYSVMSGYYAALSYDASSLGIYFPSREKDDKEATRTLVREYLSAVNYAPTTATLEQLGLTFADLGKEGDYSSMGRAGSKERGLLTTATVENIRWRARTTNRWQAPDKVPFSEGDRVYAVLEERGQGKPWKPIKLLADLPDKLPPNQIALRGTRQSWSIVFGIEKFHIPEMERRDLDMALRENGRESYAEVRVDSTGRAALVALHVAGRTWPAR